MLKIVYLPLDERPCNAKFVEKLSEGNTEYTLVSPDREMLGHKKAAASHARITAFLEAETRDADFLILSVDMLLYGGIVPSRLHTLSVEDANQRLDVIKVLKRNNPKLKVYAFHLLMRCPQYSSADEEPDYYETCGREIFLTGVARDQREQGIAIDEAQLAALESKVQPYLVDYLGRRAVNLEMSKRTIDLVGSVIDYMIIPQDDSSVYGFIAKDQREIRAYVKASRKQTVIPIYPGADEVGMTLLARCVNSFRGAPRVKIVWSSVFGASVIPLYEDRPVGETIKYQLAAAGCVIDDDADICLYVNVPSRDMLDANRSGTFASYEVERCLYEFVDNIAARVGCGKLAAVADIAYCNGGDKELASMLSDRGVSLDLAAYAGWNTSSNTLGTAICQAVLRYHYGDTPAHRKFLALRYFEDIGYCAYARKDICDRFLAKHGLNYFDAGEQRGIVSEEVKRVVTAFVADLMPEVTARYNIADVSQPWARMFETDIDVETVLSLQR